MNNVEFKLILVFANIQIWRFYIYGLVLYS